MSMSVSDATSKLDSGYDNYKTEIYDDFSNQKDQFDQEENKRKEEYEAKQPKESTTGGQNIGVKSSIPEANRTQETSVEPYQPQEFNYNMGITNFFQKLAQIMDDEFQKATPSMTNVDITTPAGTLTYEEKSDPVEHATEIGTKTAAYWALTIMPTGTPTLVSIVSVVNTAASIAAPLAADILSLGSTTETGTFQKLVDTIIKHVKTITWTVTELDPKSNPVVFTVTVS